MSVELSAHVREEIDRWVAKFPPDRKRSAVISALHAVQHENHGFLTPALMDAGFFQESPPSFSAVPDPPSSLCCLSALRSSRESVVPPWAAPVPL